MAEETVEVIEDDPIEVRKAKREALIAAGIDPYGHSVKRSHTVDELNEKYAHLEDGESTEDEVTVAGRVMARRVQGKIAFLELQDMSGTWSCASPARTFSCSAALTRWAKRDLRPCAIWTWATGLPLPAP